MFYGENHCTNKKTTCDRHKCRSQKTNKKNIREKKETIEGELKWSGLVQEDMGGTTTLLRDLRCNYTRAETWMLLAQIEQRKVSSSPIQSKECFSCLLDWLPFGEWYKKRLKWFTTYPGNNMKLTIKFSNWDVYELQSPKTIVKHPTITWFAILISLTILVSGTEMNWWTSVLGIAWIFEMAFISYNEDIVQWYKNAMIDISEIIWK